jgi:murein DD-endopeptidase MepM/ murein hydrolase activator NlpD
LNGPSNTSGHRRALIPLGGRPEIAQRFAIDWAKVGPSGQRFDGDAKNNASYFAYGSDILSVADGVVTSIKDGIPQNVPGPASRAVPITLATVGGNYVIVDIGGGRYAFYAHMQPGTLRVKVGDRVRRGQVLGLLGNSGNSTEPHLHFHIGNANAPLASEGLPYLIDAWDLHGGGTWKPQRNQLPLDNAKVRFPPIQPRGNQTSPR